MSAKQKPKAQSVQENSAQDAARFPGAKAAPAARSAGNLALRASPQVSGGGFRCERARPS